MRIGAGARKGLTIPLPKKLKIRPTLGRVREALFNIISTRIDGSTFLDLYAGTGSIGLEAHSRGASTVIFVEQNRKTAALLKRNMERYCESMSPTQQSAIHLYTLDVKAYLNDTHHYTKPADIIFADPPYDTQVLHTLMTNITRGDWLQPNGLLVIEHRFKHPMNDTYKKFSKTAVYRYGDSALSIYEPHPYHQHPHLHEEL